MRDNQTSTIDPGSEAVKQRTTVKEKPEMV